MRLVAGRAPSSVGGWSEGLRWHADGALHFKTKKGGVPVRRHTPFGGLWGPCSSPIWLTGSRPLLSAPGGYGGLWGPCSSGLSAVVVCFSRGSAFPTSKGGEWGLHCHERETGLPHVTRVFLCAPPAAPSKREGGCVVGGRSAPLRGAAARVASPQAGLWVRCGLGVSQARVTWLELSAVR